MDKLLESVALRAGRYLEDVKERRVNPAPEAVRALDAFREAMPECACAPERVVAMLDDVGSRSSRESTSKASAASALKIRSWSLRRVRDSDPHAENAAHL